MAMVRKIFILFLICLAFVLYYHKTKQPDTYPKPTETLIKYDMENGAHRDLKKNWLELIHQAAPDIDWREIEHQNMMSHYKNLTKQAPRKNPHSFANGRVTGTWYEIGSKNQAGSVHATTYDKRTDELFLISDGGILFKGSSKGNDWVSMNDHLRLDNRFLTSYIDAADQLVLVSAIRGVPYYSEDKGHTWNRSTGLPDDSSSPITSWVNIEETNQIFILHKKSYWDDLNIYLSTDGGRTYANKRTFSTSNTNNIAFCNPHHTDEFLLMEQIADKTSKVYRWDNNTESLGLLRSNAPFAWGADGRGNLAGTLNDNELLLYSYNEENELHVSENLGLSWESLSDLPKRPWQVGLYISKYDPELMFFGEVEGYRSQNGGKDWAKMNNWWEYYSDVNGSLHADIMYFSEYETKDGQPFLLVSNHGGLNVSRDRGLGFENLGLDKLNVGQFYDVRSHPQDENWVFAGTQDQGLQRTNIIDNNITNTFQQVISGDYGHITFTGNNEKMWTVYPGGEIHYYSEPFYGERSGTWVLESDDETVWIPPVVADPLGENKAYLAGGNINSGSGSYIIELTTDAINNILVEQKRYNFLSAGKGTISAMAFNPFDARLMYVATTNGGFFVSTDGGNTFDEKRITVPSAHYLYGACILPSENSAQTIYLSGSGYSTAPVVVSYDGGETFQDMSEGMPPTVAFELAANEDESLLFAATGSGPYVYVVEDERWYHLGEDKAPSQVYWGVEYLKESDRVRFGTYGRGIWDFQLDPIMTSTSESVNNLSLNVFPNPANERLTIEGTINSDLWILTTSGELIMSVDKGESSIDISSLSPGIYYLLDEKGTISKRFVKL